MTLSTFDERTQLIGKEFPARYDREVLAVIHSLPPAHRREGLWIVGIADPAGRVYRQVRLFSVIEHLHFTARMNAAGFAQLRRFHRSSYDGVFAKMRLEALVRRPP